MPQTSSASASIARSRLRAVRRAPCRHVTGESARRLSAIAGNPTQWPLRARWVHSIPRPWGSDTRFELWFTKARRLLNAKPDDRNNFILAVSCIERALAAARPHEKGHARSSLRILCVRMTHPGSVPALSLREQVAETLVSKSIGLARRGSDASPIIFDTVMVRFDRYSTRVGCSASSAALTRRSWTHPIGLGCY
jgi:hypothetical protein